MSHVLDELHRALLDDRNNSLEYVNRLMMDIEREIAMAYDDGYTDAQYDAGIKIVSFVNKSTINNQKDNSNGS